MAFGGAALLRVVSIYAPGILWDHHVFWWLYTWGWDGIIAAESWGWVFEYTPAFIGAGILSGLNASLSFFGGSVLAWALIGPLTVKYGATFGQLQGLDPETGENPFPGWYSYNSLSNTETEPSPRYWNLWVGIMVMLCASFAEVAMNGPILYRGLKRAIFETAEKIPKTRAFAAKHLTSEEREIEDPSPKSEQVPTWIWSTGVLASIALSMIVLAIQYQVSPALTILAVILAFIFSFIAAQSSGATDINPVSTCAKSSQLVFGGVTQGQGHHGELAQRINMTGGIVAAGAAAQSVDMLGDLRTGYLLSASPRVQFVAQAVGSVFSIVLCCGFFVLFSKAYPCIIDEALADHCQVRLPESDHFSSLTTNVLTSVPIVRYPFCRRLEGNRRGRHRRELPRPHVLGRHCPRAGHLLHRPRRGQVPVDPQEVPCLRAQHERRWPGLHPAPDPVQHRHGHRRHPQLHLAEEEPAHLGRVCLQSCGWSQRWRGYRRCHQRRTPGRRRCW